MGIYHTTVYGLRIKVDYDCTKGNKDSRVSPPEEPDIEINDWHFADEDSEQMFASKDRIEQTTILQDIQDLVDGYLSLDIIQHEALLARQDRTRKRRHSERHRTPAMY